MQSKLFSLRYSPRHIIPPVASRYLGAPTNPVYPKIAFMYANRDRDSLWWRVSAQHLMAYKRVVRTWLMRRLRAAFLQSLKDHGFDTNGKRITPPTTPRKGRGLRANDNLVGTVEITIHPHILKEDMSDLQRSMNSTVHRILRRQEREKRAPHDSIMTKAKWVDLGVE